MDDPLIDEIRREREAYAAQFDYDIDKIVADLLQREKASGRDYVSLPPRAFRGGVSAPIVPKSA